MRKLHVKPLQFGALLLVSCAHHEVPTVADVGPFNICTERVPYQITKPTSHGWEMFLRDMTPQTMVTMLQAPDQVTPLPTGSVAYTYEFDVEKQTRITAAFSTSWAEEVRSTWRERIGGGVVGNTDAAGASSGVLGGVLQEHTTVGCKSTLVFATDGSLTDVSYDGPTCLWPETLTRYRNVYTPCPPPDLPPMRACEEARVLRVLSECPIYSEDGVYTGFDVSVGGRIYEATKGCAFQTTFFPNRMERGFIYIENAGHDIAGYVRYACVDDE